MQSQADRVGTNNLSHGGSEAAMSLCVEGFAMRIIENAFQGKRECSLNRAWYSFQKRIVLLIERNFLSIRGPDSDPSS